ncbi:MAG: hypothetical protein GEU82_06420 [Luteitalea sp.]|nr:hypothetical protein [Luteitalea sp.]
MATERPGAPTAVHSSSWSLWSAVAGVVVTLSLIDAGQTHLGRAIQGRGISLGDALLVGFSLWLPLGGLVWPTLWLVRRVRFDRNRWQALAIHVFAAACFACILLLSASILRVGVGL